ncbi:hypothetical protein [Streptomyces chilikensis]|uniref:Uncharacterized protein n=1 Tax=Streptomyces chilikensis TaxID=1194079 RepID=A0ABV3EK24_9ACTN
MTGDTARTASRARDPEPACPTAPVVDVVLGPLLAGLAPWAADGLEEVERARHARAGTPPRWRAEVPA